MNKKVFMLQKRKKNISIKEGFDCWFVESWIESSNGYGYTDYTIIECFSEQKAKEYEVLLKLED